ncbi:general odorant-binding protein 83a-like isoform X1 [Vespula squamosa]|uniref:General odorant-binding protein 83a-like isoform X1 n=1 Tax=Vespula squamosa TaxID=30214 RepID=A0ABD2BY49_VESSQ
MIATAVSVVNACQTQTGVATADIEAVRNDEWPETPQLKCYMYCLWEQFGLIDDKGELNLNGMLTFFQRIPAFRAEVLKAISDCKLIEEEEDEEVDEEVEEEEVHEEEEVIGLIKKKERAQLDLRKITAPQRRKCLAETGLTENVIDEAEIGNFSEEAKLACYFKCVLEKFNMFTKDGKLNFKMILMSIPDVWKSLAQEMIDECRNVTGADRCELAYNFNRCLYLENPVVC